MLVMNTTEARANFAMLLKRVEPDGAAIIKRPNGRSVRITVEEPEEKFPFDSIRSFGNLSREEILDIIHASHERA